MIAAELLEVIDDEVTLARIHPEQGPGPTLESITRHALEGALVWRQDTAAVIGDAELRRIAAGTVARLLRANDEHVEGVVAAAWPDAVAALERHAAERAGRRAGVSGAAARRLDVSRQAITKYLGRRAT